MPDPMPVETKPAKPKFYVPEAVKTAQAVAAFVAKKLDEGPPLPPDVRDWLTGQIAEAVKANCEKQSGSFSVPARLV